MTHAVELDNVSRLYDDVRTVSSVNIAIENGEFFSILGPSDSDKTTCLRLIIGPGQLSGEAISIFGMPVSNLSLWERNVNTVFQNYALFPHMSTLDNVVYGLMVKDMSKKQRHVMTQETLEKVASGSIQQRKPLQLSDGQHQRVATIRALVNGPCVLLLDEPLDALNPKLREQIQFELKKLQQFLGITFIFVTHDQNEALSMSDQVTIFNNGHTEQADPPHDLYVRPRMPLAAEFIGTSNVFDELIAKKLCDTAGDSTLQPERVRLSVPGKMQANDTIQAMQCQGATTRFELTLNGGEKLLMNQANIVSEELPVTLTPERRVIVS